MSIHSWLEEIEPGFGTRYGEAFSNYGVSSAAHLSQMDEEDFGEIDKNIAALRALPFHRKMIMRRLRAAAEVAAESVAPRPPTRETPLVTPVAAKPDLRKLRKSGGSSGQCSSRASASRREAEAEEDEDDEDDDEGDDDDDEYVEEEGEEEDEDEGEGRLAGKKRKTAPVLKRPAKRRGKASVRASSAAAADGRGCRRFQAKLQPSASDSARGVGSRSSP